MKHTHYIRQSYLFCKYRNHVLGIQKYLAGRNVLEVGPNKGALFAEYYPQTRKYTLLEPNVHFEKYYIKLQKKHPNLHYKIGGFEAFSTDETFDAIVMMAVISHIRLDSKDIFARIDALLNKGGFLSRRDKQYKEKPWTCSPCVIETTRKSKPSLPTMES